MNVCIITPDFVGPICNGGIGTHCFYLARFLQKQFQANITILFSTEAFERGTPEHWERHFQEKENWKFVPLCRLPDMPKSVNPGHWFAKRSWRIMNWLKERSFDFCFFQDWQASGFHTIQAKRCGGLFANTRLYCMIHSPSEWQQEGMQTLPNRGWEGLSLDYMERYSMEHCDMALSPSRHMYEWGRAHNWIFARDQVILPYLLEGIEKKPRQPVLGDHVIFFGRLQTRKGIEIFVLALDRMLKQGWKKKLKVTFLGKINETVNGKADKYIAEAFEEWEDQLDWTIHSNLDQPTALRFLAEHPQGLVVMPSLLDNLPFAVLEAVEMGLNVLTTAVGGIPEIFADQHATVAPNTAALAKGIEEILSGRSQPALPAFSSANSAKLWTQWFQNEIDTRASHVPPVLPLPETPQITVCIPHYNSAAYFEETMVSLEHQTFRAFTVVAIDDGSTDEASRQLFTRMEEKYGPGRGWKFIRKQNTGIGDTRNFAASHAVTDYLVFVDSDNIAMPNMLEKMWRGMRARPVDCLTCHAARFRHGEPPEIVTGMYIPPGGDLASAVYDNCLGDGNFIVKRSTFEELGGFHTDRTASWEDFEFLMKLLVSGKTMDVIPENLFRYRITTTGFSKITNGYQNRMRGLRPALEIMPDWQRRLVLNAVGTLHHFAERHAKQSKNRSKPKRDHVLKRMERGMRRMIIDPIRKLAGKRKKKRK